MGARRSPTRSRFASARPGSRSAMASERLDRPRISAEEARELIASEGAQALDLRGTEDFGSGHIPGAINSAAEDLDSRLDELSKDDPVIVVCAGGEHSAKVADDLREKGYDAASIEGGMEAWTGEDLPLQPAERDYEFEGPRRPGPLGV